MTKNSRRKFNAAFKTKVVLEALKERNTIEDLSKQYELHPNQISSWKKEFLEKASSVFERNTTSSVKQEPKSNEELYKQIGVQSIEINWLKKKLGIDNLPNFGK